MNSVILMGRLCADPELRSTQSGTNVCSFRIAVERAFSKDGNRQSDLLTSLHGVRRRSSSPSTSARAHPS